MDKKETDFIKNNEDFYELKLRKKQLEFNQNLIFLIKEKTKEKRKIFEKNNSFECIKRLNKCSHSISKNINKSFSIDKSNNKSLTKTISTVTPDNKTNINNKLKSNKKKNSYVKNKSMESARNSNKNRTNISKEIENLIYNYSSKKKEVKSYNSDNSEDINNGLIQIKEINKETKEIEKDLKDMMNNLLSEENEE